MGRELRIDHARRKEDVAVLRPAAAFSTSWAVAKTYSAKTAKTPAVATPGARGTSENSVFLGNLPWDANENLIREMVDDVVGQDTLLAVRVAVDRDTGRPKGYAHVDFKSAELAEKAVSDLSGMFVLGRELRADRAAGKGSAGAGAGAGAGGRSSNRDYGTSF